MLCYHTGHFQSEPPAELTPFECDHAFICPVCGFIQGCPSCGIPDSKDTPRISNREISATLQHELEEIIKTKLERSDNPDA